MLADCLQDLAPLGPENLAALLMVLFLVGLAGGTTHCAGMCAPFVLMQVAATADTQRGGSMVRRLAGAALLPYHLGRGIGYSLLGGLVGGFAGLVGRIGDLRVVLAVLLLVAAMLMLVQASQRISALLPKGRALQPPASLLRPLGALLAAPSGWRGLVLGLLLSALPCGLLYTALAGAAASGTVLGGALAMAAFVSGTVPALVGVALLGRLFGRRNGPRVRLVGAALFALNAVVLTVMAVRLAIA